ncbi:MAG: hypothetical protein AB2A00_06620 [Myxococcota bacterium]
MSVSSVRNAIRKATSDGEVSSTEAREIIKIASRTSGINAGERALLEKAIQSDAFDSYSKSIIEQGLIRATPSVPGSAATTKAVMERINQHGLDALSGLKGIDHDKLSPELMKSLERFSGILDQNDGDTVAYTARELKVGREKLVVVNDSNGDSKELFGFFDHDGREVARLRLERTDEKIAVRWEQIDGKPGKEVATYSNGGERIPASFKRELAEFLRGRLENDGELGGQDVDAQDMPSPIRQQYEWMERNIADGTGAEVIKYEGRKLFVLHDYSCVSSSHFYTAKGTKVATVVDGEVMDP